MREGMRKGQSYTTSILVDQTPKQAFDAINNARGWWAGPWSGQIKGDTGKRGAVFTYRVPDVHYCKMRITEFTPGKKVVWHVLDSDISYTKSKTEWTDTRISFDIAKKGERTEVRFTHVGLVPADECYKSCSDAWGTLINDNLRSLISTGKGQPDKNYTATILVDATPKEAFDSINNVRGWWSEEIEGGTDKVGEVWKYHYKDVHRCTMKVTELIPGKKVVWRVLDNYFDFTKDQNEWKGTEVVFDIAKKGNKTEIRFTHVGLVPQHECYDVCSDAWGSYISGSLKSLIATGEGHPNRRETPS